MRMRIPTGSVVEIGVAEESRLVEAPPNSEDNMFRCILVTAVARNRGIKERGC